MRNLVCNWLMSAMTLAFVLVYSAALIGWLQALPNELAVMRLEPIIFVFIGYYFGRLPAQQHERALKREIHRRTQKADVAQQAKEQAQQERKALEEKVKGARAALSTGTPARLAHGSRPRPNGEDRVEAAHYFIAVALHVLDA